MSRRCLVVSSMVLLAGGSVSCTPPTYRRAVGRSHATLACAECHSGPSAADGVAAVPTTACAGSACHIDPPRGPLAFAVSTFDHVDHRELARGASSCSACHAHDSGDIRLTADATGCSVCHANEMGGAQSEDCLKCHQDLSHRVETSEGVPVAHESVGNATGTCLRCHFDVRPDTRIAKGACSACHSDRVPAPKSATVGLHESHDGHACADCHEGDGHTIRQMSSTIDLVCSQCHEPAHGVSTAAAEASSMCSTCHVGTHAATQRLILGLPPGAVAAQPSSKFRAGLTCRSCHDPLDGGQVASSCSSCHDARYDAVAGWWARGADWRLAEARTFLEGAAAGVESATDPRLARARELLAFLEAGGAAHNLELAHGLLEEIVVASTDLYYESGRLPELPPALGVRPSLGSCQGCHYDVRFDRYGSRLPMNDPLHRQVAGK